MDGSGLVMVKGVKGHDTASRVILSASISDAAIAASFQTGGRKIHKGALLPSKLHKRLLYHYPLHHCDVSLPSVISVISARAPHHCFYPASSRKNVGIVKRY
eukprot:scaffold78230_cov61-Attheya_sp.AAC.6